MSTVHILIAAALLATASLDTQAASRCAVGTTVTQQAIVNCTAETAWIASGAAGQRKVIFQVPAGTAPNAGWPVVLLFHGSLVRMNGFSYSADMPFGGYYQGLLVRTLLDNGFAVIAPNALTAAAAWQTNELVYAENYAQSNDRLFFDNLFAAMEAGHFGKLDAARWYATGISSGGYNTSRMAVSFPGRFKALAIQSASYATCVGARCQIPPSLPADHPPTLFLHGMADRVVPWTSMQPYHDRLLYQGIETVVHSEPTGGHAWFAASPGKILAWFNNHP
ncbi:extracellular medium-chain-length polyhydroxyalkanoate depolymerase [Pseudomonas subflava]|uniref:extracellular medium-chain-length polyhydroxyalkanoate depolymerase n=1 Tax=Pseudomonas subflava TaxID=2952933 RepID=UPI0020796520|nr:alpha/beta hydrolase-fold protein [Pseudomonas subflava]